MAVSRVKLSSITQGFPKSRSFLDGNSAYIPTSYQSIATITASGGETSINFTSISSSYTHLQIRGIVGCNAGNAMNLGLRFNSDTGNNYSSHWLYGDGSTTVAAGGASQGYITGPELVNNTANVFGSFIIDIFDYASTTKNKTARYLAGYDTNGAGKINMNSGAWFSTSAVNAVNLYFLGDAIKANSTFALYGIVGQ